MGICYTLENIYELSKENNPVKYSKVIGSKKGFSHKLENSFCVCLSNGESIQFEKGWLWDRASVPQLFHSLIRPDGDDDIAYCIHDHLYVNKTFSRKFTDREMFIWAKAMKQTNKWSFRNIDIRIRYYVVRLFGKRKWVTD
tara:strand:+ start:7327 stop:7749 length:423 start_codon:yes stop_codon:yes gene_type:complete